jgi:hypothetical protein
LAGLAGLAGVAGVDGGGCFRRGSGGGGHWRVRGGRGVCAHSFVLRRRCCQDRRPTCSGPVRKHPPVAVEGPWYITRRAHGDWLRLHGLPDDAEHNARAQREVLELVHHARYERKDALGRQMWRVDAEHGGWRLVVSVANREEGKLPQLLWIGKGRPARWCWSA